MWGSKCPLRLEKAEAGKNTSPMSIGNRCGHLRATARLGPWDVGQTTFLLATTTLWHLGLLRVSPRTLRSHLQHAVREAVVLRLIPNLLSPPSSITEEHSRGIFPGKESVVGLLFTAVQKSKLQILPFEISFHLGVEALAPGFILCFTILFPFFLSCLQKVLLTMQREGGSIS